MAAVDDEHRARPLPAAPRGPGPVEQAAAIDSSPSLATWLTRRQFIAAIIAINGMQLMVIMDSSVVIVALAKIQKDLGLSDAGRSLVVSAYVLAFGGLILLGGRLGDTIGRKRTFFIGVALFTIASALCGVAWNEAALIVSRLAQGIASAIVAPTCFALVATTFPKGPPRNVASAVFATMNGVGAVMGLVLGGALTDVSWRLVFLINVPIGLVVIHLARSVLQETQKERMKLDVTGAVLGTFVCTAVVFAFSSGPEKGWLSAPTIGAASLALAALVAFVVVERRAQSPVVPFDLFFD